jgi:propane 2-monooxygenase small subunit
VTDTLSPAETPTQTPTGRVRSVPKLVFTDAEAGALEFPSSKSRRFNYFNPQRMKATIYEDVTVDVQPDPERYLTQGWVYAFAKKAGGYPKEWTEAKSSDWHWFRDPNGEWEQTIYKNNARLVRQVEQNIAIARHEGAFDRWSESWSNIVATHVGAWMHPEHGLGMHVFLPAQRDAPTNMINNAISVNSMHKLRTAQDLALFNLEATDARPDFDGRAHLKAWDEDPIWQPVRENVEHLTEIRDWCEAVVAANFAFEPLVAELFRSGFVMTTAAANGDFVTPTLVGAAESDLERDLAYTRELVSGLTHDEKYGEENRELFHRWLAEPIAMSIRSARSLEEIWKQAELTPVSFEDAFASARDRVSSILAEMEIETPKELDS